MRLLPICTASAYIFIVGAMPIAAQDIASATHISRYKGQIIGFGPHAGWLAATCANSNPQSQGACLGVIWAIAEKLEFDQKACLPPNVSAVFEVATLTLSSFNISQAERMSDKGKEELWETPMWDVLEPVIRKKFRCK